MGSAMVPDGIPEDVWAATHPLLRDCVLTLLEQNQHLTEEVAALATRVVQLEEQKDRSSRNSSKPPSSDGPGQRGSRSGGFGGSQGDGKRRPRGG